MTYHIDIQYACNEPIPFQKEQLINWAQLPLIEKINTAELTLRFVEKEEITTLNHQYRQQNKPTNVLAFPSAIPKNIPLDYPLLGDIIICPEILKQESEEQGKPLEAHWAHIIMHGVLHLLGYDHIKEQDAIVMQTFEIELLAKLGFQNPYHLEEEGNYFE